MIVKMIAKMKAKRLNTLLVLLMVFAVGCNKPDEPNNGGNNNSNNGGNSLNGHEYVDLGLPSGTLWATCNVGANAPEEYGYYFAWGETTTKTYYNWNTYKHCMGTQSTMTKYCKNAQFGYNGFTDNLTTLQPVDDAATANWGENWRTPTMEQCEELYQNTTHTWVSQNGVNGHLFTSSNGQSLFFPAAGGYNDDEIFYMGSSGTYWSSTLGFTDNCAWCYDIDNVNINGFLMSSGGRRYYGRSVRPVLFE